MREGEPPEDGDLIHSAKALPIQMIDRQGQCSPVSKTQESATGVSGAILSEQIRAEMNASPFSRITQQSGASSCFQTTSCVQLYSVLPLWR